MAAFHNKVTLRGFHFEDASLTMNLTGLAAYDDGDPRVIGKAVSLDATAPNSAKLAADGDIIIGRLQSFENRKSEGIVVGAVEFQFANTLPVKAGETVIVGDTVIGAGAGEVKAAAAAGKNPNFNFVAEILADGSAVVVKI